MVFIANLAPRKMRFGLSEGMILSAGSGAGELFLLGVDAGPAPACRWPEAAAGAAATRHHGSAYTCGPAVNGSVT